MIKLQDKTASSQLSISKQYIMLCGITVYTKEDVSP